MRPGDPLLLRSGLWRLPAWPAVGGAAGSAILLVLAQPPFGFYPLSFLALVPLALALWTLPPESGGRWKATVLGAVFGSVFWAFELIWVPTVVGPHFDWAYPGYLGLLIVLGSLSAVMGRLAHELASFRPRPPSVPQVLRGRVSFFQVLALPLAWVGVEWLRGHVPFGLAWPWLGLGITLTGRPELLALAEWFGESGVSFWLAAVNGGVALAILAGRSWRGAALWVMVGLGVAFPSAAGVIRARTLELTPGPAVAVVGTSILPGARGIPTASARDAEAQIRSALAPIRPGEVDLIVVPEGTVPMPVDDPEVEDLMGFLRATAEWLEAPLAFGGLGRVQESGIRGPEGLVSNSAFLLSPDGRGLQRYDKTRLVPVMEGGAYGRESSLVLLGSDGLLLAPLVCYESIFGGLARRGARDGAELLLNLSSDIWFGHEGSFLGSLFLLQHPAHLIMRAVENRTPAARAANGGYSYVIDPLGRIVSDPVPPGGGAVVSQVLLAEERTLFTRTGDWIGPVSLVATFLFLVPWRRGRRGFGNGS